MKKPENKIINTVRINFIDNERTFWNLLELTTFNIVGIIDTPGQIEVFTWSASGQIITEALATRFPTIIIYVMDTVRSSSPVTFMSNMLYACSILYKARLPFIVALNKVTN